MPTKLLRLHPYFVTGFSDAEASFNLSINRSSRYKTGFSVVACFQIDLHIRDVNLLYRIQEFFAGIGSVILSTDRGIYIVNGYSDLINVIIPHFDSYPLITQKQADYLLFLKALLDIIQHKKHLTLPGVERLVAIRASMNLGLKDSLRKAFSHEIISIPLKKLKINQFLTECEWRDLCLGKAAFLFMPVLILEK